MIRDKVKFFKALGDGTRLKLIKHFLREACCACDWVPVMEKDQSTISRHLKVLAEAGILEYERKGKNIIYRIKNEEVRRILLSLGLK